MKRTISLIMALLMTLAAPLPTAAAESKTLKQRINDIKETYNISVEYKKSVASEVPAYLDDLEEALACLGPVFTKRLNRYFNTTGFGFRVNIVPFPEKELEGRPWIDALFVFNSAARNGYEQSINLYVKQEKRLQASVIVHEFGHALHNCIGYDAFAKINGGKKSYSDSSGSGELDTTRYVSAYATSDHYEDFAETFRCLVMADADAKANYLTLSTSDKLYRKYHFVYEQMDEFLGGNSRAAKRAAEFLGI